MRIPLEIEAVCPFCRRKLRALITHSQRENSPSPKVWNKAIYQQRQWTCIYQIEPHENNGKLCEGTGLAEKRQFEGGPTEFRQLSHRGPFDHYRLW